MTRSDPVEADSRDRDIRDRLLAWYRRERRQLPWRGTTDPYRIWVSEVMLQQTTVAAVLPRYGRFLTRFPDVATLARAREDSVVAEWSGLGYYARARNLHRAARTVVRSHSGTLPRDPNALRALPGFGEYMAAAVASLAFGTRVAAADANVTRVVSRLHAIEGPPQSRAHRARVLAKAGAMLPRARPGNVTAALMDLGQSICLPRAPRCGMCPLAEVCAGLRSGDPERYPQRRGRLPVARVFYAAAQARRDGRVYLVRRAQGSWLAGTWAFPAGEGESPAAARRALARAMKPLGLRFHVSRPRPAGFAAHTIVRRRLDITVFEAASAGRMSTVSREGRWFSPKELERSAVSTLTRKIARVSGFLPDGD
jgi:A/G-specific adenine glycosylase